MFSPEEDGEILAAPLLGGEGNFEGESDNGVLGLHQNMETTPGTSSTSASPADMILSSGPLANPVVRRAVYWALGVRTMADILPSAMMTVLHSGKFSVLVFVAVHLILLSLWLPFWVLSFALSETGVYALAVGVVFLVGRGIVRMIALPGASSVSSIRNIFHLVGVFCTTSSSHPVFYYFDSAFLRKLNMSLPSTLSKSF